jgi:predicted TIM-barrel fold metal-dependent hydrolase
MLMMIIDVHTHIFSPEIVNRRDEICYSDACFRLLYSHPKAKMYSAEELVRNMDERGISRSVVLNIGWESQDMCCRTNDYIIESISRYPERLIGFCAVQPLDAQAAIREIDRCSACGIKGIGELRPDVQGFDLNRNEPLDALIEAIVREKMVLSLHASEPVGHEYPGKGNIVPGLLYDFIKNYPQLKVILAHFGGGLPFYELMPEVKQFLKNTYYDTAAAPFLYSPNIYGALMDIIGSKKLLFGSDWPLIDPSRVIDQIKSSELLEDQIESILYGSAVRLLELNG